MQRPLTRLFSRPSAGVMCAVLIGMFYVVTIREGHDWGDDFSMYIHHAQNIAHGKSYVETGYIYNPLNPAVGPRAYPPGFPLLLAPVVKLFGLDLWPLKVVVVGFFVGSLLAIVLLFRSALPPAHLAALVLVMGFNPFFWEFKDHILSVRLSLSCITAMGGHSLRKPLGRTENPPFGHVAPRLLRRAKSRSSASGGGAPRALSNDGPPR